MFNYGFELFVNLFQGVMFTVFCYKFLTPSRNKICEGIAFCVASLRNVILKLLPTSNGVLC